MRRIRLTVVVCVSLMAMILSAAPAGAAAEPVSPAGTSTARQLEKRDPVGVPAWDCASGYSCYYDLTEGRNKLFTAARCGEHDLRGGVYQNRISSIANYGNGKVWVYIWRNAGYWELHGWVEIGSRGSFYTDDIDRIVIDC
jgi:hypothetical protein